MYPSRFSADRFARYAELSDVIRNALQMSGVLFLLEPSSLSRDDGRKPDGIKMLAYKRSFVHTFVSTHVNEVL